MSSFNGSFIYLLTILFCGLIVMYQTPIISGYEEVLNSKLIIATSFNECNKMDWEILKNYLDIVKQYLDKYNIQNKISSACVTVNDLQNIVTKEKSSFDLIIIIPDVIESFNQQITLNEYGHYSLLNNGEHIIVSQTLNKDTLSKESIWVLSHELSHFALHWYGYPKEMVITQVHERQILYDLCLEQNYGDICQKLLIYLDSPLDRINKIPVMKPLTQGPFESNVQYQSKNDQMLKAVPDWIKSTTKLWTKEHIKNNDFLFVVKFLASEGMIMIPENGEFFHKSDKQYFPMWIKYNAVWWIQDRISDSEFVNAIQYLVSKRVIVV